jgi:hypothetical protein
MSKYKVGDRPVVKLTSGRIVEATVKAVVETTEGAHHTAFFQSSFRMPSSPLSSRLLQLDDEHFPWWLAEVSFRTA